MSPASRVSTRITRAVAATLLLASFLDCAQTVAHLGRTPAEAGAHADTLLNVLGARFGTHDLDTTLAGIRPRLVSSAFVPSRIFDDSTMWTQMQGDVRALELAGARTGGHYVIGVAPTAPAPTHAADYRSAILLQQIEPGQYEWRVHDVLALGGVDADDLSRALTALFTAAEHEREAAVRAEYRASLPRATAALGRLFSLDTIQLTPSGGDAATSILLGITIHPEQIREGFPQYARYLDKYVSPAHVQLVVYDDAGAEWWTARSDGTHLAVHLRVHNGSLAPLEGAPRPMPAKLHVRMDAETKVFIFHVGVHHLVGDVSLTRDEHDKGFVATFQQEPDWVLPPFVGSMIRTALRRPFVGEGATLSFDVRDSDAGETLALRDYRIAVEESQITRWLGGLGNAAFSDFRRGAEQEADRFTGEVFAALEHDVQALSSAAGTR